MDRFSDILSVYENARKISNAYWISFGIYLVCIGLYMGIVNYERSYFLWNALIIPSIEFSLVCGVMEVLLRIRTLPRRWLPFLVMTTGNVGVYIIIQALYLNPLIMTLLFIPLILSVSFFFRRIIYYSFILALLNFIVIDLTVYSPHHVLFASGLITMVGVLAACALTLLHVTKRGRVLLEVLATQLAVRKRLTEENKAMQIVANSDALTGLANRRALFEHLKTYIELSAEGELPLHVAMIDLDHFKQVNDRYGHEAGDHVLAEFSGLLREQMHGHCMAARYGGEEFTVLGIYTDQKEFEQSLELVRAQVAERVFQGGIRLTVSMGMHTRQHGEDDHELLRMADRALYQAKGSGRNRIVWSC